MKVKSLSRVQLLATPWTAADQAPPSMGFSTQEYWSGVKYCLNLTSQERRLNKCGNYKVLSNTELLIMMANEKMK